MPANYELLQCNLCEKEKTIEVDPSRPIIPKCDLTVDCRGTLQHVAYTNRQINRNVIVTNTVAAEADNDKIELNSGKNVIAIAVRTGFAPPEELKFSQEVVKNIVRTYNFNVPKGNIVLSGPSIDGSSLYVDPSKHDVYVYINGRLIETGEYVITQNAIRLSNVTNDTNHVVVTVSEKTKGRQFNVPVKINDSVSAWSKTRSVQIQGFDYDIFFCDDFSELRLDSSYKLERLESAYVLLASRPCSSYDRNFGVALDLTNIGPGEFTLEVNDYNERVLNVKGVDLVSLFPNIEPENNEEVPPSLEITSGTILQSRYMN